MGRPWRCRYSSTACRARAGDRTGARCRERCEHSARAPPGSSTRAREGGGRSGPPSSTGARRPRSRAKRVSRAGARRRARRAARAGRRDVAELLTTIRSPGRRKLGRSSKRTWTSEPSCGTATSSATSLRPAPQLREVRAPREPVSSTAVIRGDRQLGGASSARSAARSDQLEQGGTLSSGGGRSEMSSPGNARWCMTVRMSPGSKL